MLGVAAAVCVTLVRESLKITSETAYRVGFIVVATAGGGPSISVGLGEEFLSILNPGYSLN